MNTRTDRTGDIQLKIQGQVDLGRMVATMKRASDQGFTLELFARRGDAGAEDRRDGPGVVTRG